MEIKFSPNKNNFATKKTTVRNVLLFFDIK